jgi:hypothetical protein
VGRCWYTHGDERPGRSNGGSSAGRSSEGPAWSESSGAEFGSSLGACPSGGVAPGRSCTCCRPPGTSWGTPSLALLRSSGPTAVPAALEVQPGELEPLAHEAARFVGVARRRRVGGRERRHSGRPQDRRPRSGSTLRSCPSAVVSGGALVPHPAGKALAHAELHAGDAGVEASAQPLRALLLPRGSVNSVG